jgi:hypothetical protein
MDNQQRIENEQVITEFTGKDGKITLTNLRVRHTWSQWGQALMVSILLEKISSIELHYRSRLIFVILAILAVAAGVIAENEYVGYGIGAGILFIILYLFSREHYLIITSDGGSRIRFRTKGKQKEKVLEFVNEIENSIWKRREELK